MDSIVDAALEEICPLINGLFLRDLWPKLHSSLSSIGLESSCSNVKKALWFNLRNIPGLQFESKAASFDPQDPRIQSFEDSEAVNLKIVAADHLRNSFFGIYDLKLTDNERRVLERLAKARRNGLAQNELAKEFGMKSKNIFHVVRNLELRGLIVRQSTIIKRNDASNERDPKYLSSISTSMLHLPRYAKHLGCEQRLEVTKTCKTVVDDESQDASAVPSDDLPDEGTTEDVHIKDNLPVMRAVCEKLEKADGKFLVVSDIKQDLGYRGKRAYRAWRSIYDRLKNTGLVEEFRNTVNKKEVNCLRLLKKFSPKNFELKPPKDGCEDLDAEQPIKLGKRGQVTDQLVELPIDHQVYNLIDSQGSKGMTFNEVCKRLGIRKRVDTYLYNMVRRFGMHVQEGIENGIRSSRVWTHGNFNPQASYILSSENKNGLHSSRVGQGSARITQRVANFKTDDGGIQNKIYANVAVRSGLSHRSPAITCNAKTAGSNSSQNLARKVDGTVPKDAMVATRQSHQRYLCLNLNAVRAQREKRILQMLQEQKFLIIPELQRQLTSLEKEKQTVMDRKTLDRTLSKLQQEGHCKCICLSVPSVTNCVSSRTTDVVLHPSVYKLTPELLAQIYERLRSFELKIRNKGEPLSALNGNEGSHKTVKLDVQSERSESMRTSKFASPKMVRTKLLHIFLWDYLCSSPDWDDAFSSGKQGYDRKNPHSTCTLFDLDAAIKAMPLQIFLQVVGPAKKVEDTIEKDRLGLCLSDLPMQEYKCLMDTLATARLSSLIDKLRRLKLIQLVSGEVLDASESHATLKHSLELKPYIEEPVTNVMASPGFVVPDIRPHIRHNFVLSSRKNVDEYWKKLEYCYAVSDSKAALYAFPGSTSQERASNDNGEKLHPQKRKQIFPSLKRKRCSEGRSLNDVIGIRDGKSGESMPSDLSDFDGQFCVAKNSLTTSSGEHEDHIQRNDISDPTDAIEQEESSEDGAEDHSSIRDSALLKLKPMRQRRFSWTEDADRQLVIEYVRHRVVLGANFHRTNWASLPNLPASMHTCRRRMALLNSNVHFRKAVMKFCNMLSERYIKHLDKFQARSLPDDSKVMSSDHTDELDIEEQWDDFENQNVKLALDEVLRFKQTAKLETAQGGPTVFESSSSKMDDDRHDQYDCRHGKYIKLMKGGKITKVQAYESLATYNAAELFKLVFLSTSVAPKLMNLFVETLKRYSEQDLLAAFNYLKERKIMVRGSGDSPFQLSAQFLQNLCSSPFPSNTGQRAAKMASLLSERQKELLEEGIDLSADIQCGEVFHLCALLSSGEFSISPCLPDEGVGEADDTKTLKRKSSDSEICDGNKSKKLKNMFATEFDNRRDKGFPGIKLSLSRDTASRPDVATLFKDENAHVDSLPLSGLDGFNASTESNLDKSPSPSDKLKETVHARSFITKTSESPWEAMTCYAAHLVSESSMQEQESLFSPDIFRNVYAAIEKAGDQGLSMIDISKFMGIQGERLQEGPELIVEVLEAFGHAIMVNAYDSVRVVASSYRSKYFLTSKSSTRRESEVDIVMDSRNNPSILQPENEDISMNATETRTDMVLNHSEEIGQPSTETQTINEVQSYSRVGVISPGRNHEDEVKFGLGDSSSFKPILPWINADGTINQIVYKGLVRKVLGIVMQNPGILEDNVISQMRVLNPQICRKLLELMILEKHIVVRKMCQITSTCGVPPAILGGLLRGKLEKPKPIYRQHFFANPLSSSIL